SLTEQVRHRPPMTAVADRALAGAAAVRRWHAVLVAGVVVVAVVAAMAGVVALRDERVRPGPLAATRPPSGSPSPSPSPSPPGAGRGLRAGRRVGPGAAGRPVGVGVAG